MTEPVRDSDLQELFRELRKAEIQEAPPFQEVMSRATPRTRGTGSPDNPEMESPSSHVIDSRGFSGGGTSNLQGAEPHRRRFRSPGAWAVPLLATAAALVLFLLPGSSASDADFQRVVRSYMADPAGGAWRSPTDGLLRVPGSQVLSTLPSLGESVLSTPTGPNSRHRSR